MRRLLCFVCLSLVGCGGFSDTGSGSGTLEVDARAVYTTDSNRTEIRVDVRVQAGDAEEAEVRITDDDSGEEIVLDLAQNAGVDIARYNGSFSGYRRRLEIEVERGTDDLNAQIAGPGRHVIERPANDAALSLRDIGDQLEVSWAVEDGLEADTVTVVLDESGFDATLNEDTGEVDINGDFLEVGEESVEVRRTNSIILAGGLVGSKFDFSYEAENEFLITD